MTKPIGPACNLGCRYCFYLAKDALYPGTTQWRMPDDVLREYIRQTIQASPTQDVEFAWQGGEPTLLGVEFFEKAVAIQKEFARGRRIANSLQTNGTLLDDAWGAFLARERFLVGLSVDGPQDLHDTHRVTKQGAGTFDDTMRGLEALKRHGVDFNTLTVVNRLNGDRPLDVYKALVHMGSRYLQFIPLVVPTDGGDVTDESVRPEQFGTFLRAIFDHWVRHDVGRVYVQHFDVALNLWYGLPSPACVFAETCGRALAIEHNGDVYSCDHFVEPEHHLGNIMETALGDLVDSAYQKEFGEAKRALPSVCRVCSVLFACRGECPKNRIVASPGGEPPLNYLCASYKAFFRHISPSMRAMVDLLRAGRAPAEIMASPVPPGSP